MSHFAKINSDNIVTEVIVAEQDFINSGAVGDSFLWVQTSFNTYSGIHFNMETREEDGGYPFRKNFAGIGDTYDKTRDAFIPPKLYASWTLNESTCQWEPPVAYPDTSKEYRWNEDTTSWKEIT